MKDKVVSLLGLARRINGLVLGEVILETFAKKQIYLVFVASDASKKTQERYAKKCHYYGVRYIDSYDSLTLSQAIGRMNTKTIGITNQGLARSMIKEIERGCDHGETNKEENK